MPLALVKVYSVTASLLNVPNGFSVIPIVVAFVAALSALLLQAQKNTDAARMSDDNFFMMSYRFF
jgi:hypothetical protein